MKIITVTMHSKHSRRRFVDSSRATLNVQSESAFPSEAQKKHPQDLYFYEIFDRRLCIFWLMLFVGTMIFFLYFTPLLIISLFYNKAFWSFPYRTAKTWYIFVI